MNKYVKWGAIGFGSIVLIGLIAFVVLRFVGPDNTPITDKPTPEQQVIIDKEFDTPEKIKPEDLDTKEKVFVMIHEMANTKIIAVDGQIWGLQPMTKVRIEAVKKAVKDLGIQDKKINAILERWSNKDFSQCVDDHNYVWKKYLGGQIGKAKELRK